MDESGVQYQKYMQGEPDAEKFQSKVLPQGSYRQNIPLANGADKDQNPQIMAAAAPENKKDEAAPHTAKKSESDASTESGIMKYLHAPSPGPVVDRKYRPYIPESYRDYIPTMDESGVQYQKYMQGEPDADKFQSKVLPQGSYRQNIPLANGAEKDQSPQIMAAAAPENKKDKAAPHTAKKSESDASTESGIMKYLHAPSPGPVVDRKYRPYIPESYRDYIPTMDESGVQYQKYMQGEPDAEKFQDKVLPQGSYRQNIPLANGAEKDQSPQIMAAAAPENKKDKAAPHTAKKSESDASTESGIMKYLHAPSPGPVVDRKYRPYIPESYRDYIPTMDESGVQYQKYMQGEPDAEKFQSKVLPQGSYRQNIPLANGAQKDHNPQIMAAAAPENKKDKVLPQGSYRQDIPLANGAEKDQSPQIMAAAAPENKKDKAAPHTAKKSESDASTESGIMKYLHAPSPGPVVDRKYRPYIPESYRDYIPTMDESGVQYQKYMQGEPDAEKFQDKVLPQGSYRQNIPLANGAEKDQNPQIMAAAAPENKKDKAAPHTAKKSESDASTESGIMKYLHAPSPGPVVDRKYRPYIPESYRDYIPTMDESGVQYQKYMQGEPDAEKFQSKVLPQGSYRQNIPLANGAEKDHNPQIMAAAAPENKKDKAAPHTAKKSESDASTESGIMKYLHAPSPGPVVDRKYRPFIPESYRDYIPTMDESGVQYQKYMQGEPDAEKFQDKVLPQGSYRQDIPLANGAEKDQNPQIMAAAADEAFHEPAPVLQAAGTPASEAGRGENQRL
ncbi:DHH1 [Symbiodinium sp. CCMP2592]|nr:DHH1 [Symbiodinium sp. CCMP2592]